MLLNATISRHNWKILKCRDSYFASVLKLQYLIAITKSSLIHKFIDIYINRFLYLTKSNIEQIAKHKNVNSFPVLHAFITLSQHSYPKLDFRLK